MKAIALRATIFTTLLIIIFITGACQQTQQIAGTLRGMVTIGPIWPVERPGENRPVPPQVFENRKIVIYNASRTQVLKNISLTQIDSSAKASYSASLNPGVYVVDINRGGIDSSGEVPAKIEIRAGETVTLDINIDTGIR